MEDGSALLDASLSRNGVGSPPNLCHPYRRIFPEEPSCFPGLPSRSKQGWATLASMTVLPEYKVSEPAVGRLGI